MKLGKQGRIGIKVRAICALEGTEKPQAGLSVVRGAAEIMTSD